MFSRAPAAARRRKQLLSALLSRLLVLLCLALVVCSVCMMPFMYPAETHEAIIPPKLVDFPETDTDKAETSASSETDPGRIDPLNYLETDPQTEPSAQTTGPKKPPETSPVTDNTPVTRPPVTRPIETDPPVTEPPVTKPPETKPIETDPPVTKPPETKPIETDPPVTKPPETKPIETDPPVTKPPETKPIETDPPVTKPPETEPPVTEPPETEPPVTEPPVTEPPVTEPPETEPPVTEPPETEPPVTPDDEPIPDSKGLTYVNLVTKKQFSDVLLKETKKADRSYIDQILFLGDSLTNAMRGYGFIDDDQILFPSAASHETISLYHVPDVTVWDNVLGKNVTVREAIRFRQPKLLYIELGVNGIGWLDEKTFRTEYERLIKMIREESPDTVIVVSSIYPVAKKYSPQTGKNAINNYKISLGCRWIAEIAQKYDLYYLNVSEELVGKDGFLPVAYIGRDGLHLEKAGYPPVIEYILTHTVPGFN